MGDSYNWLILVMGMLLLGVAGIATLAVVVGLVYVGKRSRDKKNSADHRAGKEAETAKSADAEVYNIVSDTVVGANLRKTDNFFQAIFNFRSRSGRGDTRDCAGCFQRRGESTVVRWCVAGRIWGSRHWLFCQRFASHGVPGSTPL